MPVKITNYKTTNDLDTETWKQGDLWVHIYIYNLISITKMVNSSQNKQKYQRGATLSTNHAQDIQYGNATDSTSCTLSSKTESSAHFWNIYNACPTTLLAVALCSYHHYQWNTYTIFTIVEELYSILRNHIVLPAEPSVIKKKRRNKKQTKFLLCKYGTEYKHYFSLYLLNKLANMKNTDLTSYNLHHKRWGLYLCFNI